jgi:hypothetical protein
MSKSHQNKPSEPSSTTPALPDSVNSNQSEAPATSVYWRLKLATANKLGKRAEGSIHYQILADIDRRDLFISITANDSGGYFSSEVVPLAKVQACLDKYEAGTPFPSKALKDVFVGLSSNNAGFLSAILRSEGVLNAAPDAEAKHVAISSLDAWKSKLLSEPGTQIELPDTGNSKAVTGTGPELDDNKTLSLPRKKAQ